MVLLQLRLPTCWYMLELSCEHRKAAIQDEVNVINSSMSRV